ncbi:MAG TPA: sugar-binding protein, partial [Tepidisphaeraceae bacterium]|nr:sugar-binding protein [Tepidisphaeraceae bacterium]
PRSTGRGDVPRPVAAQPNSPVTIEFVPRPAIAAYRRWARAQGIEHVAARMLADVVAVAGEANQIQVQLHNTRQEPVAGEVQFLVAKDWHARPAARKYQLKPRETRIVHFDLTPPASALADAPLSATTQVGGIREKAIAKAHPVPAVKVARLKSPPALDGSNSGWAGLATHDIPPTNLVQGRVKDAADSSARFRLAYDDKELFIDVEVSDDVVVSNIAPNDIRAHWRSDSVEICIDPTGGAENTLGCFKVGIFPFDTTGKVRAARDADANQGPIEKTAPATRLVSKRTPTGYRIQAAIPFSEIGVAAAKGKRLGFNLIIYDGDKRDAAIGENINKSRIAWSPRPGVQGQPEDWGRIDLE